MGPDSPNVYGVNTGFALAEVRIDDSKLKQLQTNLIRSHATGVGEPFSEHHASDHDSSGQCAHSRNKRSEWMSPSFVFYARSGFILSFPKKALWAPLGRRRWLTWLLSSGEGEAVYRGQRMAVPTRSRQLALRPHSQPKEGLLSLMAQP